MVSFRVTRYAPLEKGLAASLRFGRARILCERERGGYCDARLDKSLDLGS
jgi:hypothetical protein